MKNYIIVNGKGEALRSRHITCEEHYLALYSKEEAEEYISMHYKGKGFKAKKLKLLTPNK